MEHGRQTRDVHEEFSKKEQPRFKWGPKSVELIEGGKVHLEGFLEPTGDETMKVEWLKNGIALRHGSRFIETNDFGYVALDILYAYPEDSGVYTIRATNAYGQAITSATVKCHSTSSLITTSQQPESMAAIRQLEQGRRPRSESEESEVTKVPRFLVPLSSLKLKEGQAAHFMTKIEPINDPSMKIEWFHDSRPVPTGSFLSDKTKIINIDP